MACCQYFIDSIYSIGAYVPNFGRYAQSLVNLFSLTMIAVLLVEARRSFHAINMRVFLLREIPNTGLKRRTLLQRKRLIAKVTLTAIGYFLFELLFHFAWDMNLSHYYVGMGYSLFISCFHEVIDMAVLVALLDFMRQNACNQLPEGEVLIDLSSEQAPLSVEMAVKTPIYEASIPFDFTEDLPLTDPVVVIGPAGDEEQIQIGWASE